MRFLLIGFCILFSSTAWADTQAISVWYGFSKIEGFVTWDPDTTPEAAIVVSPGGEVTAETMLDFAESLAKQGYVVYTPSYFLNLAIIPTELFKANNLGRTLKYSPKRIQNLPPKIRQYHEEGLDLHLLGHSLGGAIMGFTMDNPWSPFDSYILYGVATMVKRPWFLRKNVLFMFGVEDKLVTDKDYLDLAEALESDIVEVKDANHFCILADPSMGSEEKRQRDGEIGVSDAQCINNVTSAIHHWLREGRR